MTVMVKKLFQSPCTPVQEVVFVVRVKSDSDGGIDDLPTEESELLQELVKLDFARLLDRPFTK